MRGSWPGSRAAGRRLIQLTLLLALCMPAASEARLEPGDVWLTAPAIVRRPGLGLPLVAPANVTVGIANLGESSLRVESASLSFWVGTTSVSQRYDVTAPVLPVTVGPGSNGELGFLARPQVTAEVFEPVTLRVTVTATDLGTNQRSSQSASATWRVQPGARWVLGQPDSSTLVQYKQGFKDMNGVRLTGERLFGTDSSNNRVLIWNRTPTSSSQPPDIALGQPDLNGVQPNNGGVGASTLRYPAGICSDGVRLFVCDYNNNRVLIWNSIPDSNGAPASIVLGQFGFNTFVSGTSSSTFNKPSGIDTDGTRLFVADERNHRVLIWNSIPTSNKQPANVVIGQPDFASAASTPVASVTLNGPDGVLCVGTRVFVADFNNNRVLVWNTIPTVNNQPADMVLGQPSFTSNDANAGGRSAASLFGPTALASDGTRLLVCDFGNSRVLVWNALPTSTQQPADLVLGQPNFSTVFGDGLGPAATMSPYGVSTDGIRVCVSDRSHRLLVWNAFPTTNGAAADAVLGQPDFTGALANHDYPSASRLINCRGVSSDGTRLFAADHGYHRVLVWNSIPSTNGRPASLVQGQPDFVSRAPNNTGTTNSDLNLPNSAWSTGSKLLVGEKGGNRVLIFNSIPSGNTQAADVVLSGFDDPHVSTDGTRLWVADSGNNRVLVWNVIPGNASQPPDLVLGQPDFTTVTANTGGLSATSLSSPLFAHSDGRRLFVADNLNNRILVWNTLPTSNGQAADVVLGQQGFGTSLANQGGLGPAGLNSPTAVYSDGTRLFVADNSNQRVLVWSSIPTSNGAAATDLLGQDSFTATNSRVAVSGFTLDSPWAAATSGKALWVADYGNKRILGYDLTPPPPLLANAGQSRTVAAGQPAPLTASFSGFSASARSFHWSFLSVPSGSSLTTSSIAPNNSSGSSSSAFTPDTTGIYRLLLTVSSALGEVATATVAITAIAGPSVSAGPNRVVNLGVDLVFTSSASHPRGESLTYRWTRSGGAGTNATLTSTSVLRPAFRAATAGTYTYTLTATDLSGFIAQSTVTISANTVPSSHAGPPQTVTPFTAVTLDGGRSTDPDGDPIACQWTLLSAPVPLESVGIQTPASSLAGFRPPSPGTYSFSLAVSDGRGGTSTATATVAVVPGRPIRALFNRSSGGAGIDVWAADLDGSNAVNLTDTPGDDLDARWSPDRGQILFRSDRTSIAHIYVMNADGSGVRQVDLDPIAGAYGSPRWSVDGRSLTYQPEPYPPGRQRASSLDGSNARFLLPGFTFEHGYAAPSPDGVLVAFLTGTSTLQVSNANGLNLRTLTSQPAAFPEWSPDRTHLLFASPAGGIWRVKLDGTVPTRLTSGLNEESPRYSPDGTRIFLSTNPGATGQRVFTVRPDGTGLTQLSGFPSDSYLTDLGAPLVPNLAPVARVSVAGALIPSSPIVLDGQATYDPNGDPLTYSWTQTAGPASGTLSGATSAVAHYIAPRPGPFNVRLTVSDGRGLNGIASLDLAASNRLPVIAVTTSQIVNQRETVRLDASTSSDPDFGQSLSYRWTQTSGTPVVLSGAATPIATFQAPVPIGNLAFLLEVSDGAGGTSTATLTVLVQDRLAPAVALSYQPSPVVTTIGLAAVVATFSEPMRLAEPAPTVRFTRIAGIGSLPEGGLTSVTASQFVRTFYATPANNGVYAVAVTGSDIAGNSVLPPTVGNILTIAIANNSAPVADAGFSQVAGVGALVTLNGSASYDLDGEPMTYAWTAVARPETADVALSGATGPRPSFTPRVPGLYVFRLSVADTVGLTSAATVNVGAVPVDIPFDRNPRADVAPTRPVFPGSVARLNGSGSSDPDGDGLEYSWALLSRPAGSKLTTAALLGANEPVVSFAASVAGPYLLRLTVSDGRGGSDSTLGSVTVTSPPAQDYSQSFLGASVPLDPGHERLGTLGTSLDTDFLAFPVQLGQVYTLALSTPDIAATQLALLSPQGQILASAGGSPDSTATIRDFRPATALTHAVRVSSPAQSTGNWRLSLTARADRAPFVPRARLSLAASGADVEAVLSTDGTSVPIRFFSALVTYDGQGLGAAQATDLTTTGAFQLQGVQQLFPPFVSLQFDTGSGSTLAPLPSGNLARLLLKPLSGQGVGTLDDLGASILEVQANASSVAIIQRPAADAGVDRQLRLTAGQHVRLDGSRSSDGANTPSLALSYLWTQVAPRPAVVELDGPASVSPSFVPPVAGSYRFRLVVSNGVLDSPPRHVAVTVRFGALEPDAFAEAREAGRPSNGASTLTAPLVVPAGAGVHVELDGRRSVDPNDVTGAVGSHFWRHVSGPRPVVLSGGSTPLQTVTLPGTPGLYSFELVTTSGRATKGLQPGPAPDLSSRPAKVSVLVPAPDRPLPALTLTAQQPGETAVGRDLGEVAVLSEESALQVRLTTAGPATVDLLARIEDASLASGQTGVVLWSQLGGPTAKLDVPTPLQRSQTPNRASASLSAPGVYLFVCRYRQTDATGLATGAEVAKQIRLVAARPDRPLPRAAVQLASVAGKMATLPLVQPGAVLLDGRASSVSGAAAYTWTQVAGPPVQLSDPSSPVTTFIAPGFQTTQVYAFELYVDDGLRSEPALLSFQVLPGGSTLETATTTLSAGINLIGVGVQPLASPGAQSYRVSDLLRDSGGSFVAWLPAGEGRFRVMTEQGFGSAGDEPVSVDRGYFVHGSSAEKTLTLSGLSWPRPASPTRLTAGLNLVAFTRGVPAGSTAATLAASTGAAFVIRTERVGSAMRLGSHVPGIGGTDFGLENLRGYLLWLPLARDARLGP